MRATHCLLACLILAGFAGSARATSIITEWSPVVIESMIRDRPQPTIGSRAMAIVYTSAYEAWAAYDPTAVGSVTANALDGRGGAPTDANRNEAISFAIYTSLSELAPKSRPQVDAFMAGKGYTTGSLSAPAELGRLAARAVLNSRLHDGANQSNGYADTSGYTPRDPSIADAWQPLTVPLDDPNGTKQRPLTPHWGKVKPFAIANFAALRPPPPPRPGTPAWDSMLEQIIDFSANLTPRQMAMVEYWRPAQGSPPMLLSKHTRIVSEWKHLNLRQDVELFFAVHNAIMDAGIACWECKFHYDLVRPVTAIRNLGDRAITAWGGPGQGAVQMPARLWHPYQRRADPTPPFPEYTSGHSTFSSAWAEVMRRLTGSDDFGYEVAVNRLEFQAVDLDPPITLHWNTFSEAATEAGLSRLYGGIHFRDGNEYALKAGRTIGELAANKANGLFAGHVRSGVKQWRVYR